MEGKLGGLGTGRGEGKKQHQLVQIEALEQFKKQLLSRDGTEIEEKIE